MITTNNRKRYNNKQVFKHIVYSKYIYKNYNK